jgi:hypothetical protein
MGEFVNRRTRRIVADMQPIWHPLVDRENLPQPREDAMLRTLLLLIALILLVGIGLVYAGVISLNRNDNGSVSIDTKSVQVGTTPANVQVPVVRTETRQVNLPSVSVGNGQGNAQ